MQKAPSQVASGNIAPAIAGPEKDLKDVYVFAGLVLVLALVIGALWFYSQLDQTPAAESQPALTGSEVSDALKRTGVSVASVEGTKAKDIPISQAKDVIHADLYFEIGRKGLTDDAKATLTEQASLLKEGADYGVLVQGYTDQQGSASYNKQLGLHRAEKVKEHLMGLGVAEHQIKTVSLGEEGVLCVDNSDVCRHMNRRVHLEIRKFGAEHMLLPAAAAETRAMDAAEPSTEAIPQADTSADSVVPPPGSIPDPSVVQ